MFVCALAINPSVGVAVRRYRLLCVWVLCSTLSNIAVSKENAAPAEAYATGDPQVCLSCHGPNGPSPAHSILTTPHGRAASGSAPNEQLCQSCHGPSQEHLARYSNGKPAPTAIGFNNRTPVALQNAQCLACHRKDNNTHWQGSAHERAGVACSSCHSLHNPQGKSLLTSPTETELCLGCHRETRAQIHKTSAHPIAEGQMGCKECHNPHGSSTDALLLENSVNDTCYRCHGEKRGPFLWEHAPVRESCANCHTPHGSVHQAMLRSRGPFLCQQCHLAPYHPSTNYSGAGTPPSGASHSMLARNCMNCHTQVHGSNHPSGIRLTR